MLGLVRSTMLHDEPMDFLWLGVLLERDRPDRAHRWTCTTTSRARPRRQQPLVQTALWLSLLRACSGFEAFMRRDQGRVSREAAVSFLLFEARFPRSLRYCVRSALALSRRLDAHPAARARSRRRAVRLEALDRWLDSQEAKDIPLSVHALLTHVVDEASAACQELQAGRRGRDRRRRPRSERKPPSKKPVSSTAYARKQFSLLEKRRKQSRPYPSMVWRAAKTGPSASRSTAPAIARWTASSG